MKKIISKLILLIFIMLISLIVILSTVGIETSTFNELISKKINQTNNNIKIKLTKIKFKIDIQELSLFLDTSNPQINYRNTTIPSKSIKVYVKFMSLIESNPKIAKINLSFKELDIDQLKDLLTTIKPSNFKSLINNKVKKGKIISELDIYLDENNSLENFIIKGSVSNLKTEILNNLNLEKIKFNFFADKTDALITNIYGEGDFIKIQDGDIKLKISSGILLESNFKSLLNYNNRSFQSYKHLVKNQNYAENLINLEANLDNSFFINFDKTYKVKKYNFKNTGKITKATFKFKEPISNNFFKEKINTLSLTNSNIKVNYSSKKKKTNISGKYSINSEEPLALNLETTVINKSSNLILDIDYKKDINFELINYQKPKDVKASISVNLEKNKDKINIKKISLTESQNLILITGLKFNKKKFDSLKKISVKTFLKGKKNNEFLILYGNKILIKGSQFDATNLPKYFKKKYTQNNYSKITKDIEIDFLKILAPKSETLKNFRFIGKIDKGQLIKISSKGDFGGNNYLDIKMKKDEQNKKKYLEVYSDLAKPLLTEYSFFKGLTGGKLLFSSVLDSNKTLSKLKIENFKVVNAPGMVKLLSLADLGGLADLAEGDGLSFDFLEINMEKSGNILKLKEILALGPSVSILMEGYHEPNGLTSLRGTLIPAKTLNKLISKIPLLGNIVIPKEVGEGLFGVSFKMKGTPGKIKTTINPIKTLTPRFIQKVIEKKTK